MSLHNKQKRRAHLVLVHDVNFDPYTCIHSAKKYEGTLATALSFKSSPTGTHQRESEAELLANIERLQTQEKTLQEQLNHENARNVDKVKRNRGDPIPSGSSIQLRHFGSHRMLSFLGNAAGSVALSVRLLSNGQPGSWFIIESAAASGFSSRNIPVTSASGNQKPIRLRIAGSSTGNIQYLRADTSGPTAGSAFPIYQEFSTDGVLNMSDHCLSLGTTTLRESVHANWIVERVRSCYTAATSGAESAVSSDSSDSEDEEGDRKLMGCDVVRLHQRFSNSYLCGKKHQLKSDENQGGKKGLDLIHPGEVYFVPSDHCDASKGLHAIVNSLWTVLDCRTGSSLENCGEEVPLGGNVMLQVRVALSPHNVSHAFVECNFDPPLNPLLALQHWHASGCNSSCQLLPFL